MGFAEELSSAKSGTPAPAVASKEEQIIEGSLADGLPAPNHGDEHPEMKASPEAAEPPKQGKIRIGTEVFDSPEDAIRYAEELQRDAIQRDAYEKGKLDALPKEEEPPEKDFFDGIENEIFENPKEAMKKVYEKAKLDAEKKVEAMLAEKEKAREQAARVEATWNSFYTSNQDLVENQDVVNYVLQKNWNELGGMQADKALEKLAEKTRAFLGSRKESTLPTKELKSGAAVTTGATGAPTSTGVKKESTPLDFISQINKHRKRT